MTLAAKTSNSASGLNIRAPITEEFSSILTEEAQNFVAELSKKFGERVTELLSERVKRQEEINKGKFPDFLEETKNVREGNWKVAPIPADLQDRRVEITGPVERKMIINALNSGAKVFMADFEDSNTPTWENNIEGHINLRDAVNGNITYKSLEGKDYKLNSSGLAVLIVRPRGWHLVEKHIEQNNKPIYGAFLDFGLYFFHNHKRLLAKNSGPYFYLPKLESHKEARLWADIFDFSEKKFGLKKGTIKSTVLIETIVATFEMEEILFELKDYIVGLNCGRWDYIFSYIKKFSNFKEFILPDRAQVLMTVPFLRAYSKLLIKTCHKRGAFAMGGMSAFIPVKSDQALNDKAIANVKADKEREAGDGHDGTWVAHPGLIPVAKEVFDRLMLNKNQLDKKLADFNCTAKELIAVPEGQITEAGLKNNISVSLRYLESWLRGIGCVPIFNLMEDAATAEIARAQVWQWVKHKAKLADGKEINKELFLKLRDEELEKIKDEIGQAAFDSGKFKAASDFLEKLVLKDKFDEFLTLGAYELIG